MKASKIFNRRNIGAAAIALAAVSSTANAESLKFTINPDDLPPSYCAWGVYYGPDLDETLINNYKTILDETAAGTRDPLPGAGTIFHRASKSDIESGADDEGNYYVTISDSSISEDNDFGYVTVALIPDEYQNCDTYLTTSRPTSERYKSEVILGGLDVYKGNAPPTIKLKREAYTYITSGTNSPATIEMGKYMMNTSFPTEDGTDTDGDTITDQEEAILGLDPLLKDSNDDGLEDRYKLELGLNLEGKDSNDDGISDYNAVMNYWNKQPVYGNGSPFDDTDGDGIINLHDVDYNNDGCINGLTLDGYYCSANKEGGKWGTKFSLITPPLEARKLLNYECTLEFPETHTIDGKLIDSDKDGLLGDWFECSIGSDPLLEDTDKDKVSDRREFEERYASTDLTLWDDTYRHDSDNDGRPAINDPTPYGVCIEPTNYNLATNLCDPLKAGIMLNETFELVSYDPMTPPLEVLRITKGREAAIAHPDGNLDTNGDGITDRDVYLLGLNHLKIDSNGDGISDANSLKNSWNSKAIYPPGNIATDDYDGNGIINLHEVDVDGDGVINNYMIEDRNGVDWAVHQKEAGRNRKESDGVTDKWPPYKVGDTENYPAKIKAVFGL